MFKMDQKSSGDEAGEKKFALNREGEKVDARKVQWLQRKMAVTLWLFTFLSSKFSDLKRVSNLAPSDLFTASRCA